MAKSSKWRSLSLPIAILLSAALIIFFVVRLVSNEKDYKDLLYDLDSSRFGNKWVAAFELSKALSRGDIPEHEKGPLATKLIELYQGTEERRTREFLLIALASLKQASACSFFSSIINNSKVETNDELFYAIVGLANLRDESACDREAPLKHLLKEYLNGYSLSQSPPAHGIKEGTIQAAIFALSPGARDEGVRTIEKFLVSSSLSLRFAAARALIEHNFSLAYPILETLAKLSYPTGESFLDHNFSYQDLLALKINLLEGLENSFYKDKGVMQTKVKLIELLMRDEDLSVSTRAKQIFNLTKASR